MIYEIRYKRKAIKALAQINEPYFSSILRAIDDLALNPKPFGYKKLKGRDGYRIRVGTYRIVYDILRSNLIIEIIHVDIRGRIYDK